MDIEEFKDFIDVTIGEIGLPLVMNEKQECISLQSEDIKVTQFSQFYILQEFLNAVLFRPVGTVCPVEQFCFSNGGVQNEYCSFHPGKKIANNEDCCYTNFFRSFGLMNIKSII